MKARSLLPAALTCLAGCTSAGAPSFEIFGAFFPAWMLCGAIGIGCGIAARVLFVATRLTSVLPYQLLLCTAIGAIFAISVWLLLFAR